MALKESLEKGRAKGLSLLSRLRGGRRRPGEDRAAPDAMAADPMTDPSIISADAAASSGEKDRAARPGIGALLSRKGSRNPSNANRGGNVEADYIDAGVISIGAERFAVSMIWTGRDEDVSIKDHARNISKSRSLAGSVQPVPNLWVEDRAANLIGLSAAASSGQKKGMRVLVTSLADDRIGARWIGAFRVAGVLDAWWIASMRDGKVFEDQMVFGRHEAEEIFMSSLEAPDWNAIIAPPEWGIPGSSDIRIGEIVGAKRGLRLRHVDPLRANMPRLILGGMVVAVAAGGLYAWSDMRARQAAEMERLREEAQNVLRVKPEDYPWHRASPIEAFIDTCRSEIERSIFLVPGWESQPISCTARRGSGAISLGWTRTSGRISWLKSGIPPEFPRPVLEGDGERASFARTFEIAVDAEALSREPWDADVMTARLRERFQSFDIALSMREKRDEGSRVRRKKGEAAPLRPIFNHHEVQIQIAASPMDYVALLEDVPALVPDALIYNVATDGWSLLVNVYHPPIFPEPN